MKRTYANVRQDDQETKSLLDQGKTPIAVAVQMGCSLGRVYKARERLAEEALAAELLPAVREAVDGVGVGKCPARVRRSIFRTLIQEAVERRR
jgi:hypothetical protein